MASTAELQVRHRQTLMKPGPAMLRGCSCETSSTQLAMSRPGPESTTTEQAVWVLSHAGRVAISSPDAGAGVGARILKSVLEY